MAFVVLERVAVGRTGADEDVRRTVGREALAVAEVVFLGVTVVEEDDVVVVVVEVLDEDEGAVVEVVLLVVDALEAVLVGVVDTDDEPPPLPVPHPATAIKSTGTARNRRRMPRTVTDDFLHAWHWCIEGGKSRSA